MEAADVPPQVADLLLSNPPNLFDVVKDLLDGRTVGIALQNLTGGRRGVGAEECIPLPVRFAYQHDPDDAAHHRPSGQEGFVGLGHQLATVKHRLQGLPAAGGLPAWRG